MTAELKALLGRFSEWNAERIARAKYNNWKREHSTEHKIMELLDIERQYLTNDENPRRKDIYMKVKAERQALGFPDEFVHLVLDWPFRVEAIIKETTNLEHHPSLSLLRNVNEGYNLRVGYDTPGIRKLKRLG